MIGQAREQMEEAHHQLEQGLVATNEGREVFDAAAAALRHRELQRTYALELSGAAAKQLTELQSTLGLLAAALSTGKTASDNLEDKAAMAKTSFDSAADHSNQAYSLVKKTVGEEPDTLKPIETAGARATTAAQVAGDLATIGIVSALEFSLTATSAGEMIGQLHGVHETLQALTQQIPGIGEGPETAEQQTASAAYGRQKAEASAAAFTAAAQIVENRSQGW